MGDNPSSITTYGNKYVVWTSLDTGLTASVPTTDASLGLDLSEIDGFRVIMSADSGQTLDLTTGSPKLLYLLYSPTKLRWMLNPNLTRLLSSADAAGGRDMVVEDVPDFVPFGRLYVAQSGITVSSGVVTLSVEAARRQR